MPEGKITATGPKGIGGDVADDDAFVPEGRRPAGAGVGTDSDPFHGLTIFPGQIWGRSYVKVATCLVEQ